MNCLPDLGQTIRDSGQWGSFALSPCCMGRATRSPRAGGAAWPPGTTSISEPSRALASIILPHRDHSQGSGQAPRFLKIGTSCTYKWGDNRGVKGAACLPDTGWGQGMVGRSSLRSGGCRLASPRGLSTKLLSPCPPPGPQSSTCGWQCYVSPGQSQPQAGGGGETPGQCVRSRSVT